MSLYLCYHEWDKVEGQWNEWEDPLVAKKPKYGLKVTLSAIDKRLEIDKKNLEIKLEIFEFLLIFPYYYEGVTYYLASR